MALLWHQVMEVVLMVVVFVGFVVVVVVVELSHSHCQPQHKNSQGPPTERS